MKLSIIYRCCELETENKPKKSCRPLWFDKEKCFDNLINMMFIDYSTKTKIIVIHDGPVGPLYKKIKDLESIYINIEIIKIDDSSNQKSLEVSLLAGSKVTSEYIYFVEDDYLHTRNARPILMEGLENISKYNENSSIISLYNHPDRYLRSDDIDRGQTHVLLGKKCHWRTAESTTCTWACSKKDYDKVIFEYAMLYKLQDREFFRKLMIEKWNVLFTPIPGASTHCHEPFLSPFIDWSNI